MNEAANSPAGRTYSLQGKRVWVAGHRGMVGAALTRRLAREGCEVISADRSSVDMTRQDQVENWVAKTKPQAVFVAAAKVGGILANSTFPADFLYENLMIEANIIKACAIAGAEKLLFLGSSCIYPKFAAQPINEASLLTGPLEETNEWYAVAKIVGIKLCHAYRRQHGCDFISAMPTNLYGPGDNYNLSTSHVIPALIRKAHEAKLRNSGEMVIWGSGTPRREFLHVDDCADALVLIMQSYSEDEHINIGSGTDLPIIDVARMIAKEVGFTGQITLDATKPDGTPRKLMSGAKLAKLGWHPHISLQAGLAAAYTAFLAECDKSH